MPYTILKVPHSGNETEVVGEFAAEADAKERLQQLLREEGSGEHEYAVESPPSESEKRDFTASLGMDPFTLGNTKYRRKRTDDTSH